MNFHFSKTLEAVEFEPGLSFGKKAPHLMEEEGPSLIKGKAHTPVLLLLALVSTTSLIF